jgi:hypothetical protein
MIFLAIFFMLTISCKETKAYEQTQIVAKEIRDKHYEERKEEERQFIKAMQDEREETVEKKIEESEKQSEHHIHHKNDSTVKKDLDKRLENHKIPLK